MAAPAVPGNVPRSEIDLHADRTLLNPYPSYAELRRLGGAVWMARYGMFAISRYADVRTALQDWQGFSSARGVTFNERLNSTFDGVLLHTDPPEHGELKRLLRAPLAAGELRELEGELEEEAEAAVVRAVQRGSFDAVADLARHLPLTVVSKYVGLPEEGRAQMLAWAEAGFNCFGPLEKERTEAGFPIVEGLMGYLRDESLPAKLRDGSWGRRLFDAGARGEVAESRCPVMLNAYVTPSLDTTINAISSGIWLFARHPEQWEAVREDLGLIPNAVNEIVRLESPVTAFTRYLKEPRVVGGVELPAGSRAIVIFASANRDERQWPDPDRFDVRREGAARQLGWGYGEHACLGMGLARLEMKAVFGALARHVRSFRLRRAERGINMALGDFAS